MNQNSFEMELNRDKNLIVKETVTQRILEIRLQAPLPSKVNSRPNLNMALVLDRSGSMHYEKLEYVKQAAQHVLDQLNEQDQVALVVYDDQIQVLAHSTKVTHGNRFELKQLISDLKAGNLTNLRDGWLTGCKEIATAAHEGTINRTLLLTDGLANVGETDPEILAQHAFELSKDAVSTSTFGVGEGFNEHLLEAMANRGGGNFYFIPRPDRISEIFLKEFNDLIGITLRSVEIKLDLPKSIEWQVLGGWSTEYKAGQLHIYVGDMLAGKLQDIYVKLQIPKDKNVSELSLKVRVFGKGEDVTILEDQAEVVFQYVDKQAVEAAQVDQALMERFSVVELADETAEALKLERMGKRDEAEQRMKASLQRNQPYISPQEAVNYRNLSSHMKNGLTEADRKQMHWDAYNIKRKKGKEKEENH